MIFNFFRNRLLHDVQSIEEQDKLVKRVHKSRKKREDLIQRILKRVKSQEHIIEDNAVIIDMTVVTNVLLREAYSRYGRDKTVENDSALQDIAQLSYQVFYYTMAIGGEAQRQANRALSATILETKAQSAQDLALCAFEALSQLNSGKEPIKHNDLSLVEVIDVCVDNISRNRTASEHTCSWFMILSQCHIRATEQMKHLNRGSVDGRRVNNFIALIARIMRALVIPHFAKPGDLEYIAKKLISEMMRESVAMKLEDEALSTAMESKLVCLEIITSSRGDVISPTVWSSTMLDRLLATNFAVRRRHASAISAYLSSAAPYVQLDEIVFDPRDKMNEHKKFVDMLLQRCMGWAKMPNFNNEDMDLLNKLIGKITRRYQVAGAIESAPFMFELLSIGQEFQKQMFIDTAKMWLFNVAKFDRDCCLEPYLNSKRIERTEIVPVMSEFLTLPNDPHKLEAEKFLHLVWGSPLFNQLVVSE